MDSSDIWTLNGTSMLVLMVTGISHLAALKITLPLNMANEPIAVSFDESVNAIKAAIPGIIQNPRVGIICGSGLSGLVNSFRNTILIPYENIPGFVTSTGESDFMDPKSPLTDLWAYSTGS
jgi:hypothetical protein